MHTASRIFVAGHRGLIGSAICRQLSTSGYTHLIQRTHAELDLTQTQDVLAFFHEEEPEYVILAAAMVGGIHANNTYPAEFIRENLLIQNSVIDAAYKTGVNRLLFLGSSCIYPKLAPQPLKEQYLLTGPLEATNRSYALAKIAGIEMCWSYNRQYGTQFVGAMPTNLYGIGDNYHLENSHVVPALLKKFHCAKVENRPSVEVWGSGRPRREFLFADDAAQACLHILQLPQEQYATLLGSDEHASGEFVPPLVNVGAGVDQTIAELAELVREVVGYEGEIVFDASRADGTPVKLLDTSRLTELGWQSRTSLKEGLTTVYREDLARIEQ